MDANQQADALLSARFRFMLEETVIPSPNSVELSRDAKSDYVLRYGSLVPHIAELFQENTKLTPFSSLGVSVDVQEVEEARKIFFETPYRMHAEDLEPGQEQTVRMSHEGAPQRLQPLLAALREPGPVSRLLYSIDLFLLIGNRLYRQLPMADFLVAERTLNPGEQRTIRSSLVRVPREAVAESPILLFLVAVPWRYMMFYGPRGYRRMMIEAGQLLHHIAQTCQQAGLVVTECQDFFDARIDQALLLDGAERSTLSIVLLREVREPVQGGT
ncbi:MAG: hypothetical protein U1A78_29150 [Polyangia bacterium]